MSRFSERWLTMRETADSNARSAAFVPALRRWLQMHSPKDAATIAATRIVDLGCGTGANLRWLAPRLARPQHWSLFDNDARLLERATRALSSSTRPELQFAERDVLRPHQGVSATVARVDLQQQTPSLDEAHLLSASALLDLVSRAWLSTLVERAAKRGTALLFALNYDGRMRFTPAHTGDSMIRDALNRDQLDDKGFGPALGPDCVAALVTVCRAHGYRVGQWRSDWQLGANEQALRVRLVDDLASIAERQARPASAELRAIRRWRRWRQDRIDDGTLHIGHVDVLALPGDTRDQGSKVR